MNRELKFRYIYECRKCGHINVSIKELVDIEEDGATDLGYHHCAENDFNLYRIKDRLQFTGLHDKNGKEIYKGEITPHSETTHNDGTITTHYGVVEWDSSIASFVLRIQEDGSQEDLYESCKWFESVGNIYENPELMEEYA